MCYGGCDCQRCSGEPPVLKTSHKPVVLLDKKYVGFESLYDVERDVMEAFDEDMTPAAQAVSGEYQGTVRVQITYTPEES